VTRESTAPPPRRRGLPLSLLRGVPIGVLLNFVFF